MTLMLVAVSLLILISYLLTRAIGNKKHRTALRLLVSLFLLIITSWLYFQQQPDLSQIDNLLKTSSNESGLLPVQNKQWQPYPEQVAQMAAKLEDQLEQKPDNPAGWKQLARAYVVLERYDEAVSAYIRAAQDLPEDKTIQTALQELKNIADAAGHHQSKPLVREKQSSAAHRQIKKEVLDKLLVLENTVKLNPQSAHHWATLAAEYARLNSYKQAEDAYEHASQIEPNNIDYLSGYAECLLQQNPKADDAKLLALYHTIHELDARHPDGLWFVGLEAYRLHQTDEAIRLWSQLLTQLPAESEAYAAVKNAIAHVKPT